MYQIENYKFNYRGIHAENIELIIVPGDKIKFNYEITIDKQHWPNIPAKYTKGSSESKEIYKELKMNCVGIFNCREVALQNAIHMIEGLLIKYKTI
ncbi:MAG: hypothetical protein ACQEUS_12630 [Bacillota bacterium]